VLRGRYGYRWMVVAWVAMALLLSLALAATFWLFTNYG
jgi:hypothetical protein